MTSLLGLPDYMVFGPCLDAPWWFQVLYVVSFTVSFGFGMFKIWTITAPVNRDNRGDQKSLEVHACYADFVTS